MNEISSLCACNCGEYAKPGNRYICGHSGRIHPHIVKNSHECACGCGELVDSDKKFINGHNSRGITRSKETRQKISLAKLFGKIILPRQLCKCGCENYAAPGKNFISYHNKGNPKPKPIPNHHLCACNCGELVASDKNFVRGHHRKDKYLTNETKQKMRHPKSEEGKENIKKSRNTPEAKAKASARQKIINARPEVCEQNRQTNKRIWQDPEYIEKQRISRNIKPNKSEIFWKTELQERYPELKWEYVGDFKYWINGKNPDFVSKKYKLVIEFNGWYFHQDDIPGEREAIFAEWGWKTFIINELEMIDMESLYKRIDEFCDKEKENG